MLENRRNSARHRVLRRGSIVLPQRAQRRSTASCSTSPPAARRLKVDDWLGLPDRFELRIENGPRREAEVRFRDMEMTGIRFLDATAA